MKTGLSPSDPVGAIIAARVVGEMKFYLTEDMDSFWAALGRVRRTAEPSLFACLATHGDIDMLALFVSERSAKLENRSGRSLSQHDDYVEISNIWLRVQATLKRRYIRFMR